MARNTYFTMSAEDIKTFASTAATVLGGLVYAIPAADMTALNSAVTGLTASITAGQVATVAFHSAIADKNTDVQTLIGALSKVAKTLYANAALTEAQIAATGFQPRDTVRTLVVPFEPMNPIANAFSNGSVDFQWDRNGSPYGVIFVIEQSLDGSSWTFVGSTKRRRVTLTGFTPGVQKWLRVKATTNAQQSLWSPSVAIYGPEQAVQLQIAA